MIIFQLLLLQYAICENLIQIGQKLHDLLIFLFFPPCTEGKNFSPPVQRVKFSPPSHRGRFIILRFLSPF